MFDCKLASLLLGLSLILISCSVPQPRGPYSPVSRMDGNRPHQLSYGVTMMDINVRNSFLLINHSVKKMPAGQIVAKITMQNVFPDEELWADVKFSFFNADGDLIDSTEWQTQHFPPRELVLIRGNSLQNNVVQFNAQFKNLTSKSGMELTLPGTVYEHGEWKDSILPQ